MSIDFNSVREACPICGQYHSTACHTVEMSEPTEIDRILEELDKWPEWVGYSDTILAAEIRRLRAELAERYEFTKALVAKYEALKTELAEEKAHGDRLDAIIARRVDAYAEMTEEELLEVGADMMIEYRRAHAAHEARRKA
jgi:hypothetical protein